jgi:gamma-glutamylcyclotransferase (GGCT)/AIG2-like uncharacterized protein YtfP
MTPPPNGEPDPPRLFVYGTLMPGRLRWPILERFAVEFRDARVPGAIYDSGEGWPVAVFGDGDAVVPGVLVDLDPDTVTAALPILDDVEDTATDKLRRVVVTTTDGDHAWAYHHPSAVDALVRIDAWHEGFAER